MKNHGSSSVGEGDAVRGGGWMGGYRGQVRMFLLLMLVMGTGIVITPVLAAETTYGSISGTLYQNTGRYGDRTGISAGTDGWTIELWNEDETRLVSTTTTRNGGTYSFIGLTPGTTYVVKEAGKGGWLHTDLSTGKNLVTIPSSGDLDIRHIDFSCSEEQPSSVEPEFPFYAVAVAAFIGFSFAGTQIMRGSSS
jgi:hypothetical protein